jgi:5,10-methylenetetrahydromethanopterin reductase
MRGVELTPEHPVSELARLGASAEAAGFDTALASAHYFNRDPFLALDRVAAATDDLRVGPAAANPYDVHPVALASRMATLQEASGGRAAFGVGPGDRSTLRALGVERERPLRRVLETLRVARRLWDGEAVSHDGTFAARDAEFRYAVDQPPVYVAAQGPDMLRMGAKHADGVLYNAAHPRDYEWAAEHVAAGRAAGDGEAAFVAYAAVSVAEAEAAAREAARPPVAFVVGGAADPVLKRHDIPEADARAVGAALEAGEFREAYAAVTDAMIDAFCVAGTPADVTDRLAALLEHADGVVVGSPLGPDPETAIPLAGEAVERATTA